MIQVEEPTELDVDVKVQMRVMVVNERENTTLRVLCGAKAVSAKTEFGAINFPKRSMRWVISISFSGVTSRRRCGSAKEKPNYNWRRRAQTAEPQHRTFKRV